MDPEWLDVIEHETDRALSSQLTRSAQFLVVATLISTAAVAATVGAAVDSRGGWITAAGATSAASVVLAVAVYLSHELYDTDPYAQLEAALNAGMDATDLRTAVVEYKLTAFDVNEGGLRRAKALLAAVAVTGLLSVAISTTLLVC